jgi:hypothetical protein
MIFQHLLLVSFAFGHFACPTPERYELFASAFCQMIDSYFLASPSPLPNLSDLVGIAAANFRKIGGKMGRTMKKKIFAAGLLAILLSGAAACDYNRDRDRDYSSDRDRYDRYSGRDRDGRFDRGRDWDRRDRDRDWDRRDREERGWDRDRRS